MYSDQERQIFRYRNGSLDESGNLKTITADPKVIWRRFSEATTDDGADYRDLYEQYANRRALIDANKDQPVDPETVEQINIDCAKIIADQAALVRSAFNIQPLAEDGSGLTEDETLDVLGEFNSFVETLKKKQESTPDSSEPTAGRPAVSAPGMGQILPPVDAEGRVVKTTLPPHPHMLQAGRSAIPTPSRGNT